MSLSTKLMEIAHHIPKIKKIGDLYFPAEPFDARGLAEDVIEQLNEEELVEVRNLLSYSSFGIGFLLGLQCHKPAGWVLELMAARTTDGFDPSELYRITGEIMVASQTPDDAVATMRFLFTALAFNVADSRLMLEEATRFTEAQFDEYDPALMEALKQLEDS